MKHSVCVRHAETSGQLIIVFITVLAIVAYIQAGVVTVWGEEHDDLWVPIRKSDSVIGYKFVTLRDTINDFYNSLPDHSSSIASDRYLNTVDLSTTDLLWIIYRDEPYTEAELSTMADFIAGGGRIAFFGPYPDSDENVHRKANANVNTALNYLGSGIEILASYRPFSYDSKFLGTPVSSVPTDTLLVMLHVIKDTAGMITSHPLTTGVNKVFVALPVYMAVSGNAVALMFDPFTYLPAMAYEDIGPGSVFVVADLYMWIKHFQTPSDDYGNHRLFENLLTVKTSSKPPLADAGPDRTVASGASCDATVTLDGSGSTDPDGGGISSYTWHLPSGDSLTDATPAVTLPVGVHHIVLAVVDDEGAGDTDTVTITVVNRPPELGICSDATISNGDIFRLRVTATDSDGTVPRIFVSGLPDGAVFTDSGNGAGLLSWQADCIGGCTHTITLSAADCSDTAGESFVLTVRDNIGKMPVVRNAACFADNGRGSVDRLEIRYTQNLADENIPDSIRVCWPDNSQCRTVRKSSIVREPADATHLTITLPEPFPEGITRCPGSNGNTGLAWHTDPSSSDVFTLPFSPADSVGPLIAGAMLIERLTSGDDTLVIDFTEQVDFETVRGGSLTLLKKDGNGKITEVPLTVSTTYPDTNGHSIAAIVPFTGGLLSPEAGDSLRIRSDGPVTDNFGNRAHPLNRPVVLTTRRSAPDILHAVYEDRNADGMVDTVRIVFNKTVALDSVKIRIEWNGSSETASLQQYRRVGTGSSVDTIDVCIATLFAADVLKDRTSGSMYIAVQFGDHTMDTAKKGIAGDGAAPVLTAVRYHFGEYLNEAFSAPDTVYVKFSELLKRTPQSARPLLFQRTDGEDYIISLKNPATVSLETAGNTGRELYYRFLVAQRSDDVIPAAGDLSWINTDIGDDIIDMSENIQTDDMNRRVPLHITYPQISLDIRVGPNPFIPVEELVTIFIKPNGNVAAAAEYRVCAFFYDKIGNIVKRFPEDMMKTETFETQVNKLNGKVVRDGATFYLVTKESSRIWWDGTNRNGRLVANGTYLAVPRIFYTTAGGETAEFPGRRFPVGVKRCKR